MPSEIRSTLLEREYKDLQTRALKTDEILSFKRPEAAVRAKTAPVVPKRQRQSDFRKPFPQEPRQSSFEQRRSLAPSQTKKPLKCFECGGSHLRRDCPRLNVPASQVKEPARKTPVPAPRRSKPGTPKMAYVSSVLAGTQQVPAASNAVSVPNQSSIVPTQSQEGIN